jgi:hypothetical protein
MPLGGRDMDVIKLDQSRRRKGRPVRNTGVSCKVLSIDHISDGVLLRVVKRHAAREIEDLKFILQVTGWDPTMLPTPEQMEEIENGTIEF